MKTKTVQWKMRILTAAMMVTGTALFAAPPGAPEGGPEGTRREGVGQHRQGPPDGGRMMMPPAERLKELGATEQQIQAVKEAAYEQQKAMVGLRSAVERAELEFRHLMEATPVDKKAVMAAVDALTAARGEVFKAEIQGALKMRETLGDTLFQQLNVRPRPPAQGGRREGQPDGGRPGPGPQGRGGPDAGPQERGGPDAGPRGDMPEPRP